nr:MAG TPA: hypothetical protein [Caudoviricetes sp.]
MTENGIERFCCGYPLNLRSKNQSKRLEIRRPEPLKWKIDMHINRSSALIISKVLKRWLPKVIVALVLLMWSR